MRSGLLTILPTLLLATACDLIGGDPSPDDAVDRLATALSTRSLEGVDLVEGPNEAEQQLGEIVAELKEFPVEVTAKDAEAKDKSATATLRWSWHLPGEDWEYDAPVELLLDGDTWRVDWAPSIVEPTLKDDEVLGTTTLLARRGDILGARGRPIVTQRPVVRFGIDKTKVGAANAPESARRLTELLDIDAAPYAARVRKAGPKAFVEALVLRERDAAQVTGVEDIPGAVALGTEMPLAPTREFAAPLLGTVGAATAELIKKSDGEIKEGDQVGLSGLQARYDDQLAGAPGVQIEAVNADSVERELFESAETNGEPLRTTLDLDLQERAEQILAGAGPASALVALRPATGEILAAASGPGSKGYNTATFGQYPPGSTFKIATSLALLRSGLTPGSKVECPPTLTVDGKQFKNYDDYPSSALGSIPLREAVANSCNTALIGQRDRLGDDDLAEAAAALGVGVDHDLGFPAYFGQVPSPESETGKAASMIGQGTVLVSPMAIASAMASVVEGKAVLPMFLPEHEVDQIAPDAPLTGAEAQALRTLLRAVVTEGSGRGLADVPGPPVLAKTGTAEFGTEGKTHTWMTAAQGDLAVAVFVEVGESGSQTAGPLLESFLRAAR
jgi:cell division protein FtsI/penicillin-binding protein 2